MHELINQKRDMTRNENKHISYHQSYKLPSLTPFLAAAMAMANSFCDAINEIEIIKITIKDPINNKYSALVCPLFSSFILSIFFLHVFFQ